VSGPLASAPARPRLRPTFQQIEIFLKVIETRSFVAAARLLGISQPAVSQAVARLEEIYGGAIFTRRRGARLGLTPIGEAIQPAARTLLDTVDHQLLRAAAAAQSRLGRLAIGFYPGIASGPLRAGVEEFIRDCPDVELRFVEGSAGDLHRQLSSHDLDIIFTAFLPDLGNPGLVQEVLWTERLVVVVPSGHAFADCKEMSWAEVARMPIILGASKGEMTGFRAIAARIGNRPFDCAHHAVSRGALLQLVRMALGITVTFPSAVVPTPGVVAIPIEGATAVVAIEAIYHAGDNNPIRHRLVRHIRACIAHPPPGAAP